MTMEAAHGGRWSGRVSSWAWDLLDTPKKATLIRVRWPFTIVCAYLLLYSERAWASPAAIQGFVLLYLASNLALYFVRESRFESFYFFALLLSFDTVFFTVSLAMSGQASTEFYVVCFATIFLCGVCRDMRGLAGVAVLSTALYSYFLLSSAEVFEPTAYLRIVFPFVISLFYGYFAQVETMQTNLRNQEELAASAGALEEAVQHQAAENSALRRDLENKTRLLEQARQVREQFLGVMSHEFRTPVNVVVGYARLLKDGVLGDVNKKQAGAVGKIMDRARAQIAMIGDMLETASMEAGESAARIQEVRLSDLLDDLKSGSEVPEGKKILLAWDYPADLPAAQTDAGKLKHALSNLIDNAIKFTSRGRVTVSARAFSARLDEPARSDGPDSSEKYVAFRVADTGIGIPPEQLPRIFDRFHQLDGSSTRAYDGLGLGLYVVKKLVGMLGAEIEASSAPGRGSTFTLTLRCAGPAGADDKK